MPIIKIGENTGDDYSGTIDSSLDEFNSDTNYGSSETFTIKYFPTSNEGTSVIAFTGLSNIPSHAIVQDATLYLYATSVDSGFKLVAKKLLINWVELTTTWLLAWKFSEFVYSLWTVEGARGDGTDRSATETISAVVSDSAGWKSFSSQQLIDDVQDFIDGTSSNYGWQLDADFSAGNLEIIFRSSENTSATTRPYLEVTYYLPVTNITPGVGSVVISGITPSITRAISVTPTAGTVVIGNLNPVVQVELNVVPSAGLITATGLFPTVQADIDVSISPLSGVVTTIGLSPTIQADIDTNVDTELGLVTVIGLLPTIQADIDININTESGIVAVIGLSPIVQVELNVVPSVGLVTVVGLQPNIQIIQNIYSSIGAVSVVGILPLVKADVDINIYPNVKSVEILGLIPDIDIYYVKRIKPYTGQIVISKLQPFISGYWTEVLINEELTLDPPNDDYVFIDGELVWYVFIRGVREDSVAVEVFEDSVTIDAVLDDFALITEVEEDSILVDKVIEDYVFIEEVPLEDEESIPITMDDSVTVNR